MERKNIENSREMEKKEREIKDIKMVGRWRRREKT